MIYILGFIVLLCWLAASEQEAKLKKLEDKLDELELDKLCEDDEE